MSRRFIIGALLAIAAGVAGWRWIGRHTNTQVHRINQ